MSGIDRSRIDPIYNTVTTAGVIPAATQKTGTITSSGVVITGTGTSFKILAQVRVGDYVYAQDQVRKVTAIFSNTRIDVNRAFVPDIGVGVDFYVIKHVPNLRVALANQGGGVATVGTVDYDGKALEEGDSIMFDSLNGLGPLAYVPNGATIEINNGEISKSGTATVVGSVNIASVIPGTGATNLGKAEDAASANGDTGVGSLAVRKLTPANTSGTDGDYEFIQMSAGKVWVSPVGDVADNAPQVQTSPNYVGGKAVDATAYSPAYTAGDAAGVAVNMVNGGILANQADLSYLTDNVVAYGKTPFVKITGAQVGVASAAYASGDVLGNQSPIAVAIPRVSGGTGFVNSIIINDLSNQRIALDIVFFDSNPSGTTFTDNSPLDIADADTVKVLGVVSISASDYVAFTDNAIATKTGINLPFQASGSSSLYFCLITRGAPTYVANELSIAFGISQD